MTACGYGGTPLRASRDTSLSPSALRLLPVLAYHDLNGANGRHCDAGAVVLAEEAAIHYAHLARYTAELERGGYIEILENPRDRRKRIYRVISDFEVAERDDRQGSPDPEPGDISDQARRHPASQPGDMCVPGPAYVTTVGDEISKIVTRQKRQPIDSKGVSARKKFPERVFKKSARSRSRDGSSIRPPDPAAGPPIAQQGDRASPKPSPQGDLLGVITGGRGRGNERTAISPSQSWAAWLAQVRRYDNVAEAYLAIAAELDDIKTQNGADYERAMGIFGKRMRERRRRFDQRERISA